MSLREAIQYSFMVLLYLLLQIFFMRNMVLFNYAFCFIYIAGILILPAEISRMYLLFIGFGLGFTVDVFSNTFGMHAAASVLIAYLRPFLIQYQMEAKGAERTDQKSGHWCLSGLHPASYSASPCHAFPDGNK
jgi:rod shape-determining protein MreD